MAKILEHYLLYLIVQKYLWNFLLNVTNANLASVTLALSSSVWGNIDSRGPEETCEKTEKIICWMWVQYTLQCTYFSLTVSIISSLVRSRIEFPVYSQNFRKLKTLALTGRRTSAQLEGNVQICQIG